jgi:hypothetical protein
MYVTCESRAAAKQAQRILALYGYFEGQAYTGLIPAHSPTEPEAVTIFLARPLSSLPVRELQALPGVTVSAE